VKKLFCFSVVLLLVFYSCKKESDPAPAPPVITFGSFTTSDAYTGVLTFNFSDADGDIGLNPSDTTGPYATNTVGYYDFYMRYYYFSPVFKKYVTFYYPLQNGNAYIDSAITPYRIPFVTNNTKSKSLNGQIIINLNQYKPIGFGDSINNFRYEFWMYDRALHKSNVVTTPGFSTPY
jgi:hypothetical protein